MRILVADDEPDMTMVLEALLKRERYSVDVVHNGQEALDYGLAGNYDCIVLDIMMPGLDGIQTLQALREQHVATPVLLLTAKSQVEDRVAGLDSGADDYLPKPFDNREFAARVRALTRRGGAYTPQVLTVGNISLACALIVFVLLLFLSRRAIRPFVDNLERQRQFVTDASHELKTPLAILSADLGLLEDARGADQWLESARAQIVRLDNAVKYCDPGGTIRLEVSQRGRNLCISVSNPCRGVDTAQLPRYFDRFYRADSSRDRSTGGYGIGLSTAKAIVTRHRGRISDHYSDGVITFTAVIPQTD